MSAAGQDRRHCSGSGRTSGYVHETAPRGHPVPFMTSKEELPPGVLDAVRKRTQDHAVIAAGKLPSQQELLAGAPFYGSRLDLDVQHWIDDLLGDEDVYAQEEADHGIKAGTLARALKRLRSTCKSDAMRRVRELLLKLNDLQSRRLDIYLACSGDENARRRLTEALEDYLGGWSAHDLGALFYTAVMLGMQGASRGDMAAYCKRGLANVHEVSKHFRHYTAAMDEIASADAARAERTPADEARDDAEWLEAVAEDRAEFLSKAPLRPRTVGLVVVPQLPRQGGSSKRDLFKSWDGHAGKRLPFVGVGDIAAARRQLVEHWPHAVDVIDTILGDLAPRDSVLFRPTLLVGSPGSGKSSLVRAICDAVELPVELYSMAGVHDASLMGTSAQWASARELTPLQLIKRVGLASVAVIWDELEKIGTRRDSGSAADALLPMLEPDQAKRLRDLALEVECDLSAVSHFATANSLEGIPPPLRDRMRVIAMPDPGWQHLHVLTRQILDRLARERNLDPRWFETLAEDEMDLVRQAWPGGSIRKLTTIVRAIVDGRAQIMGRH